MNIKERKFASIYSEFAQKIYKFCYFRVSSREEAEDIAAQVFIRAWDRIAAGKKVTNVQGFLYRIAGNIVIDFYRKRAGKHEISLDDPRNPIDVPDKSDVVERLDERLMISEVRKRLEQLPDQYREVIILRYINDIPINEIAKIMDTSENNISVRLHRAIEKLKALA